MSVTQQDRPVQPLKQGRWALKQLKGHLPSMLTAINTEEFRHTSMLMTCKRAKKTILKSLSSINFMSGAVLIASHAFLHLIFKGSALKDYDYLYYFYIIPLSILFIA